MDFGDIIGAPIRGLQAVVSGGASEDALREQERQRRMLEDIARQRATQEGDLRGLSRDTDATRAQQQTFLGDLSGAARGQAPSVAELQMRAGMDRAVGGANALAASQPGANPGMALRQAMLAQAQLAGQTNAAAGALRAGEMATARGQYAGALQGARAQDMDQEEAIRRAILARLGLESGIGQNTIANANQRAAANTNMVTTGAAMFSGGGKQPNAGA